MFHISQVDMDKNTSNGAPPAKATDAVLVQSEPLPADSEEVRGIDWAALPVESRSVIANFVLNLSQQGFQSSAIGDAIRIINKMVCRMNAICAAVLTACIA